jgi:hypothetical protein
METFTPNIKYIFSKNNYVCPIWILTRPKFSVSKRGTPGSQIQLTIQGETNPI